MIPNNEKWSFSRSSNGKHEKSRFVETLYNISIFLVISGFGLMGYGGCLESKSIVIAGLISLFFSVIIFLVSKILRESEKAAKNFKFVKNKFEKDEFLDN